MYFIIKTKAYTSVYVQIQTFVEAFSICVNINQQTKLFR